ncbi:MAG: B12-binding domain-containing radical SAM protein [Myxococcales bacterium]|nr:B12-binding domain-containing radical SAM protein [Myxococcales bacterium]MCB9896839.1 B12-binding domain-containing radical SAM protein [Planctomycetota bacterium]
MNKPKVVLFLPSRVDPEIGDLPSADLLPLELVHIAPGAELAGYEVVIIDAMTEPDYLEQVLAACEGAMAFGSSCILGYQVWDGAKVAMAVRERFPKMPIVWGGWFPSAIPELYLASDICDAVVHGQGELAFVDVLDAWKSEGRGADLSAVEGLVIKKDGAVFWTPHREAVHLDKLPEPSFHLIDVQKYYALQKRTAQFGNRVRNRLPPPHHLQGRPFRGFSYFSSFGCPEPCAFCCSPEIAGRRWLALDANVLVDRLKVIHDKDPFDVLRFQDANFGVSKKRMVDFCQALLDKGLNINWNGTIEIKQITQYDWDTLHLMKRSGNHLMWFGAEAATWETQQLIRKRIQEGMTDEAMSRMHQLDIKSGLTYIIGYPGEPVESMYDTIHQAAEMKTKYPSCSVEVFPYRPIPGSEFWQPSIDDNGYPVPENFEQWGRFFDYKFNSWWGPIPAEVQKVWSRFTQMAPWFDGIAGGKGPISLLLRKSAGVRLRRRLWKAPVEFQAFDLIRRSMGPVSRYI